MRSITSAFVALLLVSGQGCYRHVVVQPPPGQEAPREQPPPGMVEVEVVSHYDDQVWNVYAGKELVCTTPCTQWFRARQALFLESEDEDAVYVPGLGEEARQARRAMVVAEGTCHGKQVNGIVFTTLGGMGLVTAITLAAVGCSDRAELGGMCNAGLITGGISLPLTAAAIWMIVDSAPRAHVLPVFTTRAANGHTPIKFAVAPNGVVGTF